MSIPLPHCGRPTTRLSKTSKWKTTTFLVHPCSLNHCILPGLRQTLIFRLCHALTHSTRTCAHFVAFCWRHCERAAADKLRRPSICFDFSPSTRPSHFVPDKTFSSPNYHDLPPLRRTQHADTDAQLQRFSQPLAHLGNAVRCGDLYRACA